MSKQDQQVVDRQRQKQDRYLESQGLLNYQTKGMSQSDIAARYAKARVNVNADWFKQNYGNRPQGSGYLPPSAPTQPVVQDLNINVPPPSVGSVQPIQTLNDPVNGKTYYSPGYQYAVNNESGLVIKERHETVWMNGDPSLRAQAEIQQQQKIQQQQANKISTVQDALNGTANWNDVDVTQRQRLLSDPKFYDQNQINKYPNWMKQQILADPSFDWKRLPKWQHAFYSLSSSPALMGGVQGLVMGAGNPGGAIVGAALGAAASKSGYDPNKEAWDQSNPIAGAFGWMNWAAEQAEKTIGIGVQAADSRNKLSDVFSKEGWDAGAVTFETLAPAYQAAVRGDGKFTMGDLLKVVPALWVATRITDLMLHPEKYKGEELILGAKDPLELDSTFQERIAQARDRIAKGESYREVATDFQTGVMAQLGDMAGQGVADPLNFVSKVNVEIGGKIADATGNKVAAQALKQTSAPIEAARMYRTLVQTGQAMTIDPKFRVDQMGSLSRWVAGINAEGQIKAGAFGQQGLLSVPRAPGKKNLLGWINEMSSLLPEARAQVGTGMFYENIGALLTMFEDPHDAGKYLRALANNDMETWAELGTKFAGSPEFYTVLPAIKDFNTAQLDGIMQAWDLTQSNRDALLRIADVLGEEPAKILDDLAARGTKEQDFQRIVQRLEQSKSPGAKALLTEIEAGRFSANTLGEIVNVFTGDGALPWHPGQWKAQMLDAMGSHFDEWVTKHFNLKPDSGVFRVSHLMKSAQSILLLGGSPGYAITNGLSNMVHRAAGGIYGYLTPKQIDGWIDRFGVKPARLDEGVGIGGMVDQATAASGVKMEAQFEARRGSGPVQRAQDFVNKIAKGMPFNKLSSWFEKTEGRNGFVIAMRQFWNQSWRRGVGFSNMTPELAQAIQGIGVDPKHIYAAIEAGMNQADIERALFGRQEGMQSRTLVHDAAQNLGISAGDAASMLDKLGVLDALDEYLKGATTKDRLVSAFERAAKRAQDEIDAAAARDVIARAEHISQRMTIEGAKGLTDIITDVEMQGIEKWMQHYERMGQAADMMDIADPDSRAKIWDLKYQESNQEFRRFNAMRGSTYLGVLKAIGLEDNPNARAWLATLADIDRTMDTAYGFMREQRNEHFQKWRDNWDDPRQWEERNTVEARIDREFKKAMKQEQVNIRKMGDLLGKQYEHLFGIEAGEAARQAWEKIAAFRKEMVDRQQKFRAEQRAAKEQGVPFDQRAAAAREFWQETYKNMIVNMATVKQDAIAELDRITRNGGTSATPAAPTDPTMPPGDSPQPDAGNDLRQAAEARKQAQRDAVNQLWDMAEQFSKAQPGDNSKYNRQNFNDKFVLLGTLKKAEYGGDPSIKSLEDAVIKLEPDKIREIFESRQKIKDETLARENAEREQRLASVRQAAAEAQANRKAPENITILTAIRKHGGIDWSAAEDITGERNPKWQPGIFSKTGKNRWSLDQMAQILADDGYPIDLNNPTDPGGIAQLTELMQRANRGDEIYPAGHDYSIEAAAAEAAMIADLGLEAAAMEATADQSYADSWEIDLANAVNNGDMVRLAELIGDLPDEMATSARTPDGETYSDYASRMWDEVDQRVQRDAEQLAIAENLTRAQMAMEEMQAVAEAAMTRQLLSEKYAEAFPKVDQAQISDWMEISDAVLETLGKLTGETKEQMYEHYKDVIRGADPVELMQQDDTIRSSVINRRMSADEVEGYARALVRAGADELRRAVQNEGSRADKIAILDAAHKLNPKMAVDVAKRLADVLFQGEGTTIQQQLDFKWNTPEEILSSPVEAGLNRRIEINRQAIQDLYGNGPFPEFPKNMMDELAEKYRWKGENQLEGQHYNAYSAEGRLRDALLRESHDLGATEAALNEYITALRDRRWFERFGQTYDFADYSKLLEYRLNHTLFQAAKGGVQFLDGKAIIHAWDGGDISTIVHENGHIFLEMMRSAGQKTGNIKLLDDLAAFDNWVQLEQTGGVDNVWSAVNGNGRHTITHSGEAWMYRGPSGGAREFASFEDARYVLEQEMFARGFEKYLADGTAPTPRLTAIFGRFKTWLVGIYRTLTGSAIDVNLTPDMRKVFDRMVGEQQTVEQIMGTGDQRRPAYQQLRDIWKTMDDAQQADAIKIILQKTLIDPLSGLETLIAKDMSEKPAGWVEAVTDLNALTAINNTWGHGAGDMLITGIGRIAKVEVERVGGRAFRVGGDEMSYWFPDQAAAADALNAIDLRLQDETFTVGGANRKGFSISYGIGETLKAADQSLYADKTRRVETGLRSTVRDQMPPSVKIIEDITPTETAIPAAGELAPPEPAMSAIDQFIEAATPMDDWEGSLFKTRDYAKKLLEAGVIKDREIVGGGIWSTHQKLIDLIHSKIDPTPPEPAVIPEAGEGAANKSYRNQSDGPTPPEPAVLDETTAPLESIVNESGVPRDNVIIGRSTPPEPAVSAGPKDPMGNDLAVGDRVKFYNKGRRRVGNILDIDEYGALSVDTGDVAPFKLHASYFQEVGLRKEGSAAPTAKAVPTSTTIPPEPAVLQADPSSAPSEPAVPSPTDTPPQPAVRSTRSKQPQPLDMFAQTSQDLPLFSGTAVSAVDQVFAPKPEIAQESMFDMRPEFGDRLGENLIKIKAGDDTSPTPPAPVTRERTLLDALADKLSRGEWFEKSRDFESYIKNLGYDIQLEEDLNLAYDLMEGAYNLQARKIRADLDARGATLPERLAAMDALESNLTEARRTLGKMKLQQFSTPLTISEAAGWVADVQPGDIVGEPTAGTANLVDRFHGMKNVEVRVNEVDPGRREVLRQIGYDPSGLDLMAPEWVLENGKKLGPWATVQISNPPWGSYSTGKYGKPVNFPVKMNDWSQRFTYLELQRLAEDGRFVGVMPANWLYTTDRATRGITNKPSEFYRWLQKNYTVQAVIESPPGSYKQRATDISSLLVVIDKTPHLMDNVNTIERFGDSQPKTWEEYAEHVNSVPKRTQEAVTHGQEAIKQRPAGPDAAGIIDPAAIKGIGSSDVERIGQPTESPTPRPVRSRGVSGDGGQEPTTPMPAERDSVDAARDTGETRDLTPAVVDGQPAGVSPADEGFTYSDAFQERLANGRATVKDSGSFTEYVGRAPLRDGDRVHPHPTVVVETKGLASVPYPSLEETYRPSPSVMRAMNNRTLSYDGNIDPVWAAIQQNDKHHMGMLIGDDVGMGKSRTGAAFVIDRLEKGKKKILVITKDQQNVLNLMNKEFPQVYAGVADENGAYTTPTPTDFPAERVFLNGQNFPKVKKGEEKIPTFDRPAVYFMTRSEFMHFTEQLKELKPDVIVVDEAHEFKNVGTTSRGVAWTDLHKDWLARKADILYLTATPGTDLADLQYLYGLRVWSMDGFGDWVKIITGQESPEKVKGKQEARVKIDNWLEKVNTARLEIDAEPTTITHRNYGEIDGMKVGEIVVFKSPETWQKGKWAYEYQGRENTIRATGEAEAVILANMVSKRLAALPAGMQVASYDVNNYFEDASAAFVEQFAPPGREDIRKLEVRGITEASDILKAQDKRQWGQKSGIGAFDSTLPPAHTEQIMRELKVAGSYMSRDISRAGVEFGVKEYTPPPAAKAAMNRRIEFYRKLHEAFTRWGKANEGPQKAAAMFGISGDIQADAKRALFNMRLPGVIEEADAAIAKGQQVVISVVSVSEVDGETGSLQSAIQKINTHKVEKIGKGEYSDPTDIPEALLEINELKEMLTDMDKLPSPIDVLREKYGDRVSFVNGNTSTPDRMQAADDFQRNRLDVVVISGAGKTGINLHDITGKRRVHLIVGDYEWSATTFKQELGRVDRTGERTAPVVTVMHTGSAGEKKFVATISNRMKGLGATSKGGSESTGTGALTENFELGTTLDKIALNAAWQEFPVEWKLSVLDDLFHDKNVDGAPVATLTQDSATLSRFLKALQSIDLDTANQMMDAFMQKRAELMQQDVGTEDAARKTSANSGEILRQVDLSDNLRLSEVRNTDGQKFAVIDGVLTPHMNKIKTTTIGGEYDPTGSSLGNGWMRWVQFYDPEKNTYVTGLRVAPGKIKAITEEFGRSLASEHKPETAHIDLKAGDRIKLHGANAAEWELYMGKAGRDGKIVIDGARLKDKDTLMKNGAMYNSIGNYFYVPEENLKQFFERFPIRNEDSTPPMLYQDDAPILPDSDPAMPLGGFEQAAGWLPESEVRDQGWSEHVKPLLNEMQNVATKRLQERQFAGAQKDLSPEGQGMLQDYMKKVQGEMATNKLATVRWGENQRDYAMFNYNKKTGIDKALELGYPYQLYYTRAMLRWMAQAVDGPAWFSNYARLQRQRNRYENDLPERLRGKFRIPAPWLPKWAGDSMWVDPIGNLFPPASFIRPFERMQQDRSYQQIEAERILQEWASDGSVNQAAIQEAVQTHKGSTWERAFAEAQIRRESEVSNPMDFFNTMIGPAWYLSAPMNLMGIKTPFSKGDPGQVSTLPITNTARAVDTVTNGTWAEPVGNVIGLLGKPEEWARKQLKLPTLGEYGDYYTKRQIANMVAEGSLTAEQAQMAMIEKKGEIWQQATERVKMELAMRVPLAGTTYALTHGGPGAAAQAALPSLFGSGLLPAGELEYRGLKQEWNQAWKEYDSGNTGAVNTFFDKHPEYQAYLAKGKSDDELLKSFLIGQVWDGYMALGDTNKKAARAQMGELFNQAFLDKETRSYETLDVQTLTQWAQMLNKQTPQSSTTPPQSTVPAIAQQQAPKLNLYDQKVTGVTDQFFQDRTRLFPDYYQTEQGYYNLPKSGRSRYLIEHPELKQYWQWKDKWYKQYPDMVPIFKGQTFKTVDTSTWSPALVQYVSVYAMTGQRLPKGAMAALTQAWIREGQPYGDVNTWLNSQVVPAMMYQPGQ